MNCKHQIILSNKQVHGLIKKPTNNKDGQKLSLAKNSSRELLFCELYLTYTKRTKHCCGKVNKINQTRQWDNQTTGPACADVDIVASVTWCLPMNADVAE